MLAILLWFCELRTTNYKLQTTNYKLQTSTNYKISVQTTKLINSIRLKGFVVYKLQTIVVPKVPNTGLVDGKGKI